MLAADIMYSNGLHALKNIARSVMERNSIFPLRDTGQHVTGCRAHRTPVTENHCGQNLQGRGDVFERRTRECLQAVITYQFPQVTSVDSMICRDEYDVSGVDDASENGSCGGGQ